MPPTGDLVGVLLGHTLLVGVAHHRTGMHRAGIVCGECYRLVAARRDGGFVPLGHRRAVLTEEARGERMVSDESEAQRRVYLASRGVKSEK